MPAESLTSFHDYLLRQARNEPRKAAVLAALLTMVGVLWTRVFLFDRPVPSAAGAASVEEARSDLISASVSLLSTEALSALQEWKKGPIAPPSRNVFEVKLDYYPQDGSKPATSAEMESEGIWDAVAKSLAERADQEKARRILVENLQAQAARLQLQSTVMSNGTPKALVNGTLVGEGDSVGGFRVVKIESKRIIVEREGVKLEVLFNF